MKRLVMLLLATLVFLAVGQSASADDNGAVVNHGTDPGACGIGPGWVTTLFTVVSAPDGSQLNSCQLRFIGDPSGLPRRAMAQHGIECLVGTLGGLVFTTDATLVITPAGTALLVCQVHASP